jgi:hypothetical protein
MKALTTLLTVLLVFIPVQLATGQGIEPLDSPPICGTETAMAKMPMEYKAMTMAAATVSQANELLLYINFNPGGSVVRPGFGNADTLTTPLVQQARFCPAPTLSQEQKDEIVRLVSDDLSPFSIRVTTDAAEFAAYPRQFKEMCLITTQPQVIGMSSGTGGVSPFVGLGFRLPGDLVFVFSSAFGNDPRDVASTVSHELGHILGLGHQHLFTDSCGFITEYHPGFGSGPVGFFPLMGNGLGSGIDNWFAQSCIDPIFGSAQNDYELINSQVVARPDDFPDDPSGGVVDQAQITGYLERAGDADHIRINFKNPGVAVVTSDNIDLKVSILNPGGKVMGVYNDPNSPNVTIPAAKGMRYLKIEAAGNANMAAQFGIGTYHVSY